MEEKLIPAPIDNKVLMEDIFEDNIFQDFYAAKDHRKADHGKKRHLVGLVRFKEQDDYWDAYVEVVWHYGHHMCAIRVIAVSPNENFSVVSEKIYEYYKRIFKGWENPDNEDLRVRITDFDGLVISFLRVAE